MFDRASYSATGNICFQQYLSWNSLHISYMTIKILLVDLNKLWTKYTPLKHNIVKASDNYNKKVLIDYKLLSQQDRKR